MTAGLSNAEQPYGDAQIDASSQISIVDDDPSVQRALGRLCRSAGYSVTTYGSAEAFLESASANATDVLILDVHLPGRSGLQLQHQLRVADRRCPIVFVTAFQDDQARRQALKVGAVDFFRKPLDTVRLLDVIESTLNNPGRGRLTKK